LRKKQRYDGYDSVSQKELWDALSKCSNSVLYLPYARDILFERGDFDIIKDYEKFVRQ